MNTEHGRERLTESPSASVLPAEIVAASAEGFRLRGVLEAAFHSELRIPERVPPEDAGDVLEDDQRPRRAFRTLQRLSAHSALLSDGKPAFKAQIVNRISLPIPKL